MTRYRRGRGHLAEGKQHLHAHDREIDSQSPHGAYDDKDRRFISQSAFHDDALNSCEIFVAPRVWQFILNQLVISRVFLLVFQTLINWIMRDSPTDAFKGLHEGEKENLSALDSLVRGTLSGLSCWDARHFLHIAEFGYLWESSLAFFPLFPAVLHISGSLVQICLWNSLNLYSAMLLSGTIINNVIFILNGFLLLRLMLFLNGGNLKEAIIGVYMHCWSPASIFYTALYSESLYSTFTLLGLIFLFTSPFSRFHLTITAIIFSCAFLTRSNGLTNAGFILFQLLIDVILTRSAIDDQLEFREFSRNMLRRLIKNVAFFLLCFALISLPLRVFEFAMKDKFCSIRGSIEFTDTRVTNYLQNGSVGMVLPGELAKMPWCNESFSPYNLLMPGYYSHIQQKYWNVGLLAYWKWRKFPLFMLAAPTLALSFYGIFKQTLLLMATDLRPIPDILFDRRSLIPFALQSLFLAFSGLIMYNVEVSIRLLYSASPFLYIVLAKIICAQTPEITNLDELMHSPLLPFLTVYAKNGIGSMLILVYLLGFFIFGTMAHVNWLPYV